MSNPGKPSVAMWLMEPLSPEVKGALGRLQTAAGVVRIAVMPDVHLANEVCVGMVMATDGVLYPQAVGGDIGCGMFSVATELHSEALRNPRVAGRILAGVGASIPSRRRNRRECLELAAELEGLRLSDARLEALKFTEGITELGTLGSGNHFLELQADEEERVWLTIHSGSRGMGQRIRDHHMAKLDEKGWLRGIAAESQEGLEYQCDVAWARKYAEANRVAMAREAEVVLKEVTGDGLDWESAISTDHNHVSLEEHDGQNLWVHRKGAMRLSRGELGVLPGSMGTESFHVEGRGCAAAMDSSAHGAGRRLSRGEAARRITPKELERQMHGVWFDWRMARALCEEAPEAYKDVRGVLRAQEELVKVRRRLRPLLNYKGS